MRNLIQYPLTLDEIENYLQNKKEERGNIEDMPIGGLEGIILDTLLSWVVEKKEQFK